MPRPIVLSFYDYTTEAVKPWAKEGFECYCFDIQHEETVIEEFGTGLIIKESADLHSAETFVDLLDRFSGEDVRIVLGFPVCTDLAVSGAAHFKRKAKADPDFQIKAAEYAKMLAEFADVLNVPYMIENPVSRLATLWRKPNYSFHPFEYGGYIAAEDAEHPLYTDYIAPRDAYSKKTCLWTGNGFVMPQKMPVDCESFGSSRQHRKLGGKSLKTKNIRSATPRGFAIAVYTANH